MIYIVLRYLRFKFQVAIIMRFMKDRLLEIKKFKILCRFSYFIDKLNPQVTCYIGKKFYLINILALPLLIFMIRWVFKIFWIPNDDVLLLLLLNLCYFCLLPNLLCLLEVLRVITCINLDFIILHFLNVITFLIVHP